MTGVTVIARLFGIRSQSTVLFHHDSLTDSCCSVFALTQFFYGSHVDLVTWLRLNAFLFLIAPFAFQRIWFNIKWWFCRIVNKFTAFLIYSPSCGFFVLLVFLWLKSPCPGKQAEAQRPEDLFCCCSSLWTVKLPLSSLLFSFPPNR